MTGTSRLYLDGVLQPGTVDTNEIDRYLQQANAILWVDVAAPTPQEIEMLGHEFGFHELALEDSLDRHERPKVEQYDRYFFMIAYALSASPEGLLEHEVAVFVGTNYLVTVRKDPVFDFADVVRRWEAHHELSREGGGYLLYVLLDEMVDGYFDALDEYEDRIERVEEQVFGRGRGGVQGDIFALKKELLQVRRHVTPLRDVLDVMLRRTVEVVTEPLEPYYRDVYDHVLRVTDFLDNLRDILSSALEAHLAVVSNRLNEVMKQLTSWAAIILIPTLVAGIYGMNFTHMPELRWRFGYPYALAVMALSAFVLYRMFKRREWL